MWVEAPPTFRIFPLPTSTCPSPQREEAGPKTRLVLGEERNEKPLGDQFVRGIVIPVLRKRDGRETCASAETGFLGGECKRK